MLYQFFPMKKHKILVKCEDNMAKEETIKLEGSIIDVLPNAMFKIELESGNKVLGYISGRMRQNDIKILLGDTVEVEFSPYDLTKGRITRRK